MPHLRRFQRNTDAPACSIEFSLCLRDFHPRVLHHAISSHGSTCAVHNAGGGQGIGRAWAHALAEAGAAVAGERDGVQAWSAFMPFAASSLVALILSLFLKSWQPAVDANNHLSKTHPDVACGHTAVTGFWCGWGYALSGRPAGGRGRCRCIKLSEHVRTNWMCTHAMHVARKLRLDGYAAYA